MIIIIIIIIVLSLSVHREPIYPSWGDLGVLTAVEYLHNVVSNSFGFDAKILQKEPTSHQI